MSSSWLAKRTQEFDSSGIRKVFDLAANMPDPINLSIGQPDFPVPAGIKPAAMDALRQDKNGYSVTQGVPELLETLQTRIDAEYGHQDRRVLITSGTSGALVLSLLALVDPGDEVICFDPYFVMYPTLINMVGGQSVLIETYPDFRIDVDKVAAAITSRTKMILLNSPANPTGSVADKEEVRALAALAAKHNIALLSDEIYREFSYDAPPASPTKWNEQTIVVDGFSKSYGVTGWRLGWIHGPSAIIDKLTMMQQYTFVCAPHPLQWAGLEALKTDISELVAVYRQRRERIIMGLENAGYQVAPASGAFYVFPKIPEGYECSTQFVKKAIDNQLLIIPGSIFSGRDTHFRISYAANDETIERGLEVLKRLRESA
ncbi:MAG: pyridoxal phosphate-dependent aminotransferase [Pirellulales bacterium]|nr:pyridoxal phosphate-dependent aminotransferase [Pirellulales bacterium]